MPVAVALLLPLAILAAAANEASADCDLTSCNIRLLKYYQELGCIPVTTPDQCCPTSFDCSSLTNRNNSFCHYRGQTYNDGEHIAKSESANPCLVDCICRRDAENSAQFSCVSSECPDVFGPPLPPGCVRLYQLDRCCATRTYCDDSGKEEPYQCEYQGKTYLEGQYIYSEDNHCKSCICQQGFNGSLDGPWCRDLSCDIELHNSYWLQQGCAPVYYGTEVCCPIDWRCPTTNDSIIPGSVPTAATDSSVSTNSGLDITSVSSNTTTEADNVTASDNSSASPSEVPSTSQYSVSDDPTSATTAASNTIPADSRPQCQFGPLRLNIGDQLSPGDNPCVVCTCSTPPHVACQQTPHALCNNHRSTVTTPLTPPSTTSALT